MDDPVFRRLQQRARKAEILAQHDLEQDVQRSLDRRTAQLAIALRNVGVADGEQAAIDGDRVVHHRPRADPPIVDVAAVGARWNGADAAEDVRRDSRGAEVRAGWDADAFQRRLAVAHRTVGDRAGDKVFARESRRRRARWRTARERQAGRSSPAPSRRTPCTDSPSWPRDWSRRRSGGVIRRYRTSSMSPTLASSTKIGPVMM